MKKLFLIFAVLLCIVFAGCNQSTMLPVEADADSSGSMSSNISATVSTSTEEQTATLYVGTESAGFREYSMTYEEGLTPELLIRGIADLTGWDLTLAEAVTSGKGGMSVCLSNESALFIGPPDPQNEEFHMYDSAQLAQTVLDSIKKTLQMNFIGEGGNPDSLDIYYYMEGEQPLTLPDLGLSWPLDQPYQWPSD